MDAVRAMPREAIRAEQPKLDNKSTVDDAIYAIFSSCIKHWKGNESPVARGRSAEAIHQMRVALRRMGTALADCKDIIPNAQYGWMKRETAWLVTSLGPARDWDVFIVELLAPVAAALGGDASFTVAKRAAEAKRKHGYARAQSTIRSRRYSNFAGRIGSWLSTKSWHEADENKEKVLGESARKFSGAYFPNVTSKW